MKKLFLIIPLFLLILVGAGCDDQTELTKEQVSKKPENKQSLLEQKEKCFGYKEEIENKENVSWSDGENSYYHLVKEVFYSPKEDSCLFILFSGNTTTNEPGRNGTFNTYKLYDYFSSKSLISEIGCSSELSFCGQSTSEAEKQFNDKIKQYK